MPHIEKTLRSFGLKRSAMFAKGAVSIIGAICLNRLRLIRPPRSTPLPVPVGPRGRTLHRLG